MVPLGHFSQAADSISSKGLQGFLAHLRQNPGLIDEVANTLPLGAEAIIDLAAREGFELNYWVVHLMCTRRLCWWACD